LYFAAASNWLAVLVRAPAETTTINASVIAVAISIEILCTLFM